MASSARSFPEERLLLQEITHRINNEFAAVIEIVSLTAARSSHDEVKLALAGVLELLHNYARVHRVLRVPTSSARIDASAYLRELCQSVSRCRLRYKNIELILLDQPLQIASDRCWLLGMIISELITNAFDHAFDRRGGKIQIETVSFGEFVECRVSDNGSAVEPIKVGSGLRIVDALMKTLGGTLDFHCGNKAPRLF
jgi:two-component sensor histidine kinase